MRIYIRRCLFFALVGTVLVLGFAAVMAQMKKPPILKEPGGVGIDKGMVVAFGKKIDPPYFVTWEDGKVLINGIVFLPREKAPPAKPEGLTVTALTTQKHDLLTDITKNYVKYHMQYGKDKAQEMILEEYGQHPLISGLKYEYEGQILRVDFTDGDCENINLESFIMEAQSAYPSKQEIELANRQEVDLIKSSLQSNRMIAFGYDYTLDISQGTRREIEDLLQDVARGTISYEDAEEELYRKLGPQGRRFWEDVRENIQMWE